MTAQSFLSQSFWVVNGWIAIVAGGRRVTPCAQSSVCSWQDQTGVLAPTILAYSEMREATKNDPRSGVCRHHSSGV